MLFMNYHSQRLSIFFLMNQRHLISTLFPYTTLFRSRATEKLIRDLHMPKRPKKDPEEDRDPEIRRIEKLLGETFGAPVKITSRDGMKGEIKIRFETPNHLEEILDIIDQSRI